MKCLFCLPSALSPNQLPRVERQVGENDSFVSFVALKSAMRHKGKKSPRVAVINSCLISKTCLMLEMQNTNRSIKYLKNICGT